MKIKVRSLDLVSNIVKQFTEFLPTANTLTPHILRTLSNLTHNHGLYTVLLNLVSHIPQPSAYNKSKTGQDIAPAALPSPPSIFPDNKTVPVLSELLTPWLDMHLLVDKVAKGKEDARKMTEGRKRDVETVSVVEVLADRWGGREGGWGVIG